MNKKVIIGVCVLIVCAILGVAVYSIVNNGGSKMSNTTENSTEESLNVSENDNATETKTEGKNLILYFSQSGNTEKFAKTINNEIKADIIKIQPSNDYPTVYEELADYAKNERDTNQRPEIKNLKEINIEDYDTIFIGYPIWWYQMPMIMYTLFDNVDFSGKTIIPFNTHEGSGNGGTYDDIKKLEPNANVLEGLPIRGGDMKKDQTSNIQKWLNKMGY